MCRGCVWAGSSASIINSQGSSYSCDIGLDKSIIVWSDNSTLHLGFGSRGRPLSTIFHSGHNIECYSITACHIFSESYAQQLSDFELRGYLIGCLWSTSLNKDYHQLGDQRLSILPHFWFGFGFGWGENRFVPPSMTLKGFHGNPDSQNWFAEAFLTFSIGFVGMLFLHYKCLQSRNCSLYLQNFPFWPKLTKSPVVREMHNNIWCHFHVKGNATTTPILATKKKLPFDHVLSKWNFEILRISHQYRHH